MSKQSYPLSASDARHLVGDPDMGYGMISIPPRTLLFKNTRKPRLNPIASKNKNGKPISFLNQNQNISSSSSYPNRETLFEPSSSYGLTDADVLAIECEYVEWIKQQELELQQQKYYQLPGYIAPS